jgi:hypothetical protein
LSPQLDSIKKAAHQQILSVLTPEQRTIMEMRRQEMARKDSASRARRDSIRAANKSAVICNN